METWKTASVISFEGCVNEGNITGYSRVGGLVGSISGSKTITLSNCINNGTVTGIGSDTGGIVGGISSNTNMNITISNCINHELSLGMEQVLVELLGKLALTLTHQ